MTAFIWDSTYEVGHELIDREHRGLVFLINEVLMLQGDADCAARLPSVLARLMEYAATHFRDEEKVMCDSKVDVRHIHSHQEAHRAFTREVLRIRDLGLSDEQLRQLGEFLTGWLMGHILSYDRSLLRQIRYMESGNTPAEAYEAELAVPDDPASRNLMRAMSALFPYMRPGNGEQPSMTKALESIAREQLATQTLLSQIIEGAPIPTIVLGMDQRVSHWNRACALLSGVPAHEVVGTPDAWKGFYPSPRPALANVLMSRDEEAELERLYPGCHQRSPVIPGAHEVELFFPHLGTAGRWLHVTAAPLHNPHGQLIGAIETLEDVTERRQAKQVLLDARADLEREVAARTQELLKRNAELTQLNDTLVQTRQQLVQAEKLASIGQLAAGVAHEINNPIGYVHSNIGSLEHYLQDMFALLDAYETAEPHLADPAVQTQLAALRQQVDLSFLREDVPDLMRECREGITRVKKIVQDLKDFSRIDNRQEFELADLHQGLDSTLNIVANELKYKADVVKQYGDLPPIECLASQLNQVFMNLLVNAAQAMGEQRGTITVRTGTQGDQVWVEVADNGSGMPPDVLSRIFDPFFTTKPVGKGTGLGLSLSYGIVQHHHGTLTVDSHPGVGTTFRITLPVRQTAGTPAP
jgi:hemerythrin-like metal-binding protein